MKKKDLFLFAGLMAILLLPARFTYADQLIDPALLFINYSSTPAPLYGGELNAINPSDGLSIDFHGGSSSQTFEDPGFLLILGVPTDQINVSTYAAPGITTGNGQLGGPDTLYNPDTDAWYTPENGWDATTGAISPLFNAASAPGNESVYNFIGLLPAVTGNGDSTSGNSENISNWSGYDQHVNGFTPGGFKLFVYDLRPTNSASPTEQIGFNSGLPQGTYAIAYGINQAGNPDPYDTPFTQAGLVNTPTNVPEPGTLFLLGIGLLGLVFAARVAARNNKKGKSKKAGI